MREILNSEKVLQRLWEAFGQIKKPIRITSDDSDKDSERAQIRKHFQHVERETMSHYDVSMMLVDGALILPEVYLYFLPRLAEAVIHDDADNVLLRLRLDNIDLHSLTSNQIGAIEDLKKLLDKLEAALVAELENNN